MAEKNIYVTMPTLAPLEEVNELMKGIWESGIMTHNGPLVQRFEKECAEYHEVPNLVTCVNGTIALQMAIRALRLKAEIITTPFTFGSIFFTASACSVPSESFTVMYFFSPVAKS